MYDHPMNKYDLVTMDIRPVMPLLDLQSIRRLAYTRHDQLIGRDPNHAMIFKIDGEYNQKAIITSENILDDFICKAINSFEHTWVHRNLSHLTPHEIRVYQEQSEAWSALYKCLVFDPAHAGMFAHYQRIKDSIFLAIPKF